MANLSQKKKKKSLGNLSSPDLELCSNVENHCSGNRFLISLQEMHVTLGPRGY
jgi:hypothetical protein